MIPRAFITHWKQTAPWVSDAQVEQDLVINMRLKIEINCREHDFIFGPTKKRYAVEFGGKTKTSRLPCRHPEPAQAGNQL